MKNLKNLTFASLDGRFNVFLESETLQEILSLSRKSIPNETGGILVGRYNNNQDLAIITKIITSPSDSRAGRTWFHRGIKGLKYLLNCLWSENIYYLGEWHFHPFASPNPSSVDIKQIKKIALSKDYNCPEPILLIVGGDPKENYCINTIIVSSTEGLINLVQKI